MEKSSLVMCVVVPMCALLLMGSMAAAEGLADVVRGGCFSDNHCDHLDKGLLGFLKERECVNFKCELVFSAVRVAAALAFAVFIVAVGYGCVRCCRLRRNRFTNSGTGGARKA